MGYIVLCLMVVSFVITFYSQREKDQLAHLEKEKLIEKSKKDSIKQRKKYQVDSLRHEITIKKLGEQRYRDSLQISNDSVRFDLTLKNFGKQLSKQNETLQNLEELQHPISPLKVRVILTVKLDSLSETAREYLKQCRLDLKNISNNGKPDKFYNFDWGDSGSIECRDFYPKEVTKYDSTFTKFNRFMYDYVMPKTWFYFYIKDKINKIDERSADLFLLANGISNGGTTFNKDFILSYKYNIYKNEVRFNFSFQDPIINEKKRTISSMYSIRDGLLAVRMVSYDHNAKMVLNVVEFRTGNNFYDRYLLYFNEKDLFEYDNEYEKSDFYIKKGAEIFEKKSR
ncbi:hypothetical protein Q4Q35_13760 [Flavivirga aquimarina]|uniref:Uncharacterized protein n=1 Tax=Flavivirga aquimarina TaxID=2027862 RepID=A0ABT8WCK1_9FLAO|nr:hypothetical protein [Flavivirga aquimarina]